MKSFSLLAVLFVFAGFGLLVPHAHAAEQQLYTCGMHPQVIKTEPGNCPICGMKLTPIRSKAAGSASGRAAAANSSSANREVKFYKSTMIPGEVSPRPAKDSMGMDMVPVYADEIDVAGAITIDPVTIQKMNLKTDVVRTGPVRRTIRAVGAVAFNEQGLADITTKYEGWIEKLFVNATWTRVAAGAPLFEIYSPDLYNAQLNLLVALRSEGEKGGPLTNAARARLELFDVPAEFIASLAQSGKPQRTVTYRAPIDGVVIEKPAVQGMMIRPGEKIFRLADLSTVWVNAQIYESDLAFVHEGQEATVRTTYGEGRELRGRVEQLLPEVSSETRTVTARLVLENPEVALKPGMFVDVRLEAELQPDAVLVPDLAVLRSGEHTTVFVARDAGTFEPRDVELGARTEDNFYAVRSGLSAGERVVTSGQFLLDSESQLRAAIQAMLKPDAAAATHPSSPVGAHLGATMGADAAAAHAPAAAIADAGSPSGASANDRSGSPSPAIPTAANPAALQPVALAAADAAATLAADNLDDYRQSAPRLRDSLAKFVAANPQHALAKAPALSPSPADLETARREFEPVSTAIADAARAAHLQHTAGLRVFECPMSPVLGKARWLQREPGTHNPFFGSEMPGCGEQIDGPADAAAPSAAVWERGRPARSAEMRAGRPRSHELPPGHPPIAGRTPRPMTGTDFLRSQMGEPVVLVTARPSTHAGDGCGGCGMSAAAMAAGEPCEHDQQN